ncbi:unnamed protein product [Scytosiphon promiscuus]
MDIKASTRLWVLLALVASAGLLLVQQFRATQPSLDSNLPGENQSGYSKSGERSILSGGNVFQAEGCPYALSKSQADKNMKDEDKRGNTINLVSHGGGRCGNHYMTLSSYFAMGYCCRSRLLTLPPGDSALPYEQKHFAAKKRWFDFSDVVLPWPEFQEMGDDPEVCRPDTQDGGDSAFGYESVHEKVLECMNRVYLRGCEKAYLGDLVDLDAHCPKRKAGERKGAGSLVVHIRSGDIFDPDGEGGRRNGFGQPPLQYYLHVLGAKEWDDVTILTAAWQDKSLNPTYSMLEMMAGAGTLGKKVKLFKNRSLLEDVREMLCANALATSRSSMSFLTFAHSRATTFFVPSQCGKGAFRRMKHPPVKASFDNTTLLLLEKPEAEVYGIEWRRGAENYSVYEAWHDNPEQLLEMTTYGGIDGLQKCVVDPPP